MSLGFKQRKKIKITMLALPSEEYPVMNTFFFRILRLCEEGSFHVFLRFMGVKTAA
jgi:hypothetical protein